MAKKINNKYLPGYIYELGVHYEGDWYPFYVGETTNTKIRLQQHLDAAKQGKERLVYDFIRELTALNAKVKLVVIDAYYEEGPKDLEDEHIMNLLLQGYKLQNMKKGSAKWMDNMLAIRDKMLKAGFTSLRKYKMWDAEQERIKNDARHEQRVAEHEEKDFHNRIQQSIKNNKKIQEGIKDTDARRLVAEEQSKEIMNRIRRK